MAFPSPPIGTPLLDSSGQMATAWSGWFLRLKDWASTETVDYAPNNAKYIVRQSNSDLTDEQALNQLQSGFIKVNASDGSLTSTGNTKIQASELADTSVIPGPYGESDNLHSIVVDGQGRITDVQETTIRDLPHLYKIGSKITSSGGTVPSIWIQDGGVGAPASLHMQPSGHYWTTCDDSGAQLGDAFYGMNNSYLFLIGGNNEYTVTNAEILFSMQDATTPVRIEQRGGDALGRLYFSNGTYNTGFKAGTGAASDQILELPDAFPAGNNYAMVSSTAGKLSFLQVPTGSGTSSGTNTGDQNLFSTIAVSGQSNVVADSTTDTLTLVAGTNVTITTDASTDSVTINASGGSYTDEQAQDAIGSILTDTATIDFTYTDATPTIEASVKANSITNAMLAGSIDLTTKVTGVLPVANGGSGRSSIPCCSVYNGTATTLTASTSTKVKMDTEEYDVGGYFDTSSYRYTPLVAGKYFVTWSVFTTGTNVVAGNQYTAFLFKNGAGYKFGQPNLGIVTGGLTSGGGTAVVEMNGITDYLEVYFYNTNPTNSLTTNNDASVTYFAAYWLGA